MDPCAPVRNPLLATAKRYSRQKNWQRPEQTETDRINENPELIQQKLENYVEATNIDIVSVGTHVRYYIFDTRYGEYKFRLGGLLAKKDAAFVVLANGSLSWSVPKETEHNGKTHKTRFFRILNPTELEQKRADSMRQEKDKQSMIVNQQLQELEKQKAEIEKLKKVIMKMSNKDQLTSENKEIISSARGQKSRGDRSKYI
jgi:hypothetical protein